MPGVLLSGPAGAGKSQAARELLASLHVPGVIVDFQSLYAALLQLERNPDGRYPERLASDVHVLAIAEYLRRSAITAARRAELFAIVTNSDGAPTRRAALLSEMGPGAVEQVIDPGEDVVTQRLSGRTGKLSTQCKQAVGRWYGRIGGRR